MPKTSKKKVWLGYMFWNNGISDAFYWGIHKTLNFGIAVSKSRLVKNGQTKIRITVEEI